MRKRFLVVAIALLALPMVSYAQPVINLHADWVSGGTMDAGVIQYDPSVDGCLCFNVLLDTSIGVDGVQFITSMNAGVDDAKWKTCADPWVGYPPFYIPGAPPNLAGFDYYQPGGPGTKPALNDYVSGIGDNNVTPSGGDGVDDMPNTLLSAVGMPELYFKGAGSTNIGTDMLVGGYCIEPAVPMNYSETYVLDLLIPTQGEVYAAVDWDGDPQTWNGVYFAGGDKLTIHIVPEPVSALLLLAGLPFLRRRR